jgi:hypothetical protein
MKLWQKRMTSLSDLPFGSKSEPPLPPPMGRVVRAFLKICSKPRNLMMPRLTEGWNRSRPCRADRAVELDAHPAIDLHLAAVVLPRHAEHDHAFGLDDPLEHLGLAKLRVSVKDRHDRLDDFVNRLMEFLLLRIPGDHLCMKDWTVLADIRGSPEKTGRRRTRGGCDYRPLH